MKNIQFILFVFLPLFFPGLLNSQTPEEIRFVAHRGASYLAPENTLASIQLAWELGAVAAECDVMLTGDKEVILCHDKNTKKLTGRSFVVSETSWEQLSQLRVKPRKTNLPGYDKESIPHLRDVLATLPEDRLLVIEMKTGPEILPHLQECLDAHWKQGRISFIAFDFETITAAKSLYPDVPCYYLSMFKQDMNKHVDLALEKGLDGLNLRHTLISPSLVDACKRRGLDVWCWTVNDPETARKMMEAGVSAITTDRPAWLREKVLVEEPDYMLR